MKSKELTKELAKRLGWTIDEVSGLLSAFSSMVGSRLLEGDSILLDDFGQFETRKKAERISVNPSNGKRYLIPPKLVALFKPGNTIKSKLKEVEQP